MEAQRCDPNSYPAGSWESLRSEEKIWVVPQWGWGSTRTVAFGQTRRTEVAATRRLSWAQNYIPKMLLQPGFNPCRCLQRSHRLPGIRNRHTKQSLRVVMTADARYLCGSWAYSSSNNTQKDAEPPQAKQKRTQVHIKHRKL